MSNIFEGARFGAPYKAKNGEKVFFLGRLDDGSVSCLVGNEKSYGFSILEDEDIVSKWVEPVDEGKLDIMARREIGDSFGWPDYDENGNDKYKLRDAFKAGYRKAMVG